MREQRNFFLTVGFFCLFWLFMFIAAFHNGYLHPFVYQLLFWTTAFSVVSMFPFEEYLKEQTYNRFSLSAEPLFFLSLGFFWIILISTKNPFTALTLSAVLVILIGLNIADIILPARKKKLKLINYEIRHYYTGKGGGTQHILKTNQKTFSLRYLNPNLEKKIKKTRKGAINGSWKYVSSTPIFHRLIDIN